MMKALKMIPKYMVLWALIIFTLQLSSTQAEMSAKAKAEINSGISTWGKICDVMKLAKDTSLLKSIGEMAPYFGAVGGVISFILIFLPQQESAELRFMKQQFAEVNTKLDQITTKLDHLENLLKYEVQRAAYLESAKKITYGYQKLNEFFDEVEKTKCGDRKHCARVRENILSRYIKYFDIQFHLYKILTGSISKTPFNEPLLDLLTKKYQCDVGKLDTFSNGVLKLAFKAQMVILTYEKVTGSNVSVVNSMKTWLNSVYLLRDYTYKVKNTCHKDIKSYMLTDIKNSKYQIDFDDSKDANNAMRVFMREKYAWLDWNVYSYNAYGGDNHNYRNVFGDFWNSPKSKEKRKRNIVVTSIDKSGTYQDQRYWVGNAIDDIARNSVCGLGCASNMKILLDMIVIELKKKDMWKYILSLNVLRESISPVVLAGSPLTYLHKVVTFKRLIMTRDGEREIDFTVHVLITVKSLEMAAHKSCKTTCTGHGRCIVLPYSSETECQCKRNFDGRECKKHSKNGIAATIDALIAETLHLPTLVDIYHDIKDLREDVNIGFEHIEEAIKNLRSTLVKSYNEIGKAMSHDFAWVNLQIIYSQSIQEINYYSYRFNRLQNSTDAEKEGRALADAVLQPEGVQKWVYNLDELFMGNTISPIGAHKPFMIMYMTNHLDQACSSQYKVDVDGVYRQFAILQQKGYIIWAQALEIVEQDTTVVQTAYKTQLQKQTAKFTKMTCQYQIPASINIHCSGGRYIHPKMVLTNKCKTNYYIKGNLKSTCVDKASDCTPCSCYAAGSHGSECTDRTGKCKCKTGFYGDKCENRDCVWSGWSGYSSCSKGCDYGGTQYMTRSHKVTKVGHGKACPGSFRHTRSCFNGCCSNQFHCSNKAKCIPASYKCDYDNDCGDKQDEKDSLCQESCSYRYTPWNSAGDGDVYYLDRHNADCGGSVYVLQSFHLERSGDYIRYRYKCCQLNKNMASYHQVTNSWTYTSESSVYLDRQYVNCASDSYLNGFHLQRSSDYLRYRYYCDKLDGSNHRSRQYCFTSSTSSTYDGDGLNYYLDRQTVGCGGRYFLNHFRLKRSSSSYWYYQYTCCRVLA